MTNDAIRQRLQAIPLGGNAKIAGLIVERVATCERWVVNVGVHGFWVDIDGAVERIKLEARPT